MTEDTPDPPGSKRPSKAAKRLALLESDAYESLTVTLDRDELLKIIVKGMSYGQFEYESVDIKPLYDDFFQIILTKPHDPAQDSP